MKLPFVKMHGLGNDFVVIDERRQSYRLTPAQLRAIADRRYGVGCDQILFLEPASSAAAQARYRVANADGSAAEHCGNGIRCIARFLQNRGEAGAYVDIEVGAEAFRLAFTERDEVRVDMGRAHFAPAAIPLARATMEPRYVEVLDGQALEFGAVSVGNPHATVLVEAVDNAAVAELGPALQASGAFPAGVNVGFMQVTDARRVRLRVYERGAGETRACGTGACAAVVIGRRWELLDACVDVELRGGKLTIEWAGGTDDRIWMTGPADWVFEGSIEI